MYKKVKLLMKKVLKILWYSSGGLLAFKYILGSPCKNVVPSLILNEGKLK